MTCLITGSCGMVGFNCAEYFLNQGFKVLGIDNNMRAYFFGPNGSTKDNATYLKTKWLDKYEHVDVDIRNYTALEQIFKLGSDKIDLIIHTAAQPSHDWAAKEPLTDFSVNVTGTINLLELTRLYVPNAVFIYTSTNKVYGDRPNFLPLKELETRMEFEIPAGFTSFSSIDGTSNDGVSENMSIDNCLHSVFGASKAAADIMVQEYGKYFGMKTSVFRGGCLTAPIHAGVELHGFLSYLVKCIVSGREYNIFGYQGKQVRDNIHAHDIATAFHEVLKVPRQGEVYNLGGNRFSNCSMKEAITKIEELSGKTAKWKYVAENRKGDHIWYISDMNKFKSHYPNWVQKYDGNMILEDLVKFEMDKK